MENSKTLAQQVAEAQDEVTTWPDDRREAAGLKPIVRGDGTVILRWQERSKEGCVVSPQEEHDLMAEEIYDLRRYVVYKSFERLPYEIYLSDRADGVKGHYTLARKATDSRHTEYWNVNSESFNATGTVLNEEEAMALLKTFVPATNNVMNANDYAELYKLREAVKGPDGFDTWQAAAVNERTLRVQIQAMLKFYQELAAANTELIQTYRSHDLGALAHLKQSATKGPPDQTVSWEEVAKENQLKATSLEVEVLRLQSHVREHERTISILKTLQDPAARRQYENTQAQTEAQQAQMATIFTAIGKIDRQGIDVVIDKDEVVKAYKDAGYDAEVTAAGVMIRVPVPPEVMALIRSGDTKSYSMGCNTVNVTVDPPFARGPERRA